MQSKPSGIQTRLFIEQMNMTAKSLGLTNTNFNNPHGLPDYQNVSTASDMAVMS